MQLPLSAFRKLFKDEKADEIDAKAKRAKNIDEQAKRILSLAQKNALTAKEKSQESMVEFGHIKLYVLESSVRRFVDVFEKIHNIDLENSVGLDELSKYHIDKQSLLELRMMSVLAVESLGEVPVAASAGALLTFGAYGATMTFANAAEGTAIATLSGMAAKNATLAFLGGGDITVGGGGMFLGTIALAGLVTGPSLFVLSIASNAYNARNAYVHTTSIESALDDLAKARDAAEQLSVIEKACDKIAWHTSKFSRLLRELDAVFVTLISQLEFIVSARGTDYAQYSEYEQKRVAMVVSLAGAIKRILDTPILNEDGGLTRESELTHAEMLIYQGKIEAVLN